LHILIPLNAKYEYEQSRQFAEIVCHVVHKQLPKTTSMERSPEKRPKKIYLDCLQNRVGQSIVAPYAVRPRPKAMVSTPLLWDEVKSDLILADYTIETVPERVKEIGEIFKPILQAGVDMKAGIARLKDMV
jgi:bifunctional non-homologous end joining protein LigD